MTRRARWRATAIVLLAGAAASAVLAVRTTTPGGARAGTLATPLWSPRRVPELLVGAVGAQHLQSALDANLAAQPGACYVVAEGAQPIATHNPDTPLVPASTEKLLTTAAALAVLGPDFKYETKAVAAAAPTGDTVDRLWLVGAGDPVLATADYAAYLQLLPTTRSNVTTRLEPLADAIVARGIRNVPGGIIGDDSRYDQQRYLPSWPPNYRTDPDVGPLGALTVNSGYRLIAGNHVTPTDDPALAAASTLALLLQTRGVKVGPATAHQAAPAGAAAVGSVTSPPLHDIVASGLRSSDNLDGELLAKEIGVKTSGQGTTAAGTRGVAMTLQQLGVPTAGTTIVDGSGLDRGNRVTCRALTSVLALGAQPRFRSLLDGLPIAGQTGTLILRLKGTPLEGKLHAKTGSLNGVSGLAGLLDAGRPIRFALVVNGALPTLDTAQTVRESFAAVLGTFPQAPSPDQLVPGPDPPRPG